MIISILLLLFILSIIYIFFLEGSWPKKSNFHIDFDHIDELLKSDDHKSLPKSIHTMTIATGKLPSWAVVSGNFTKSKEEINFPTFQIKYDNYDAVLEVPFNEYIFKKFPYSDKYYHENYDIMQTALSKAELIFATHEHWDHIGGIAQSENLDCILDKFIITHEQMTGPTISDSEFPDWFFDKKQPITYEKYLKIAPGIVLIKSSGHSVGHQFVFIKLANNKTFLFTGDVVWTGKNFIHKKNRPLIASKKRLENREQIKHQMRYLYENFIKNNKNDINLVFTHDPKQIENYIEKGLIQNGFIID